ncbi:hypothetical protein [Ornithinibacillus scapharcae]|uniref:hypothetical protein n=1 Tax=Ornithinibacillus scapharcae TaxID=1147159 RepID=UPI000225AA87|nr:hypothetical protein [Ornithinibacillus scapharcae]
MNKKNKYIQKAVSVSLLITFIAFFIGENPNKFSPIYLLFVGVASFLSVYLISMIIARAQQSAQKYL